MTQAQEDTCTIWNQLKKELVIDDKAIVDDDGTPFREDQGTQLEELTTLVNQARDEEDNKLTLLYELQCTEDKCHRDLEVGEKLDCTLSDLLQENKQYSSALKQYSDKISEEERNIQDLQKQKKCFEDKAAEKIMEATAKLNSLKNCENGLCQDIEDNRMQLEDLQFVLDTDAIDKENMLKKTLCNLKKSVQSLAAEMEGIDDHIVPAREKLETLTEKTDKLEAQLQQQQNRFQQTDVEKARNKQAQNETDVKELTEQIQCMKEQISSVNCKSCKMQEVINKMNTELTGLQQQLEEKYQALEESTLQVKTCKNCDKEIPRLGPTEC